MNLIIAIGKEGELAFNNRRVSRDEYIIRDIFESVDGDVYIKPRSAKIFSAYPGVKVIEGDINSCPKKSWIFIEDSDAVDLWEGADKILVYNFNRIYPYDVRIDTNLLSKKFKTSSKSAFPGHSHEKITKTLYEKE